MSPFPFCFPFLSPFPFLPPNFGGGGILVGPDAIPFGKWMDSVVQNEDEFHGMQTLMKNINDFPTEVAGFTTKYGDDVSQNIVHTLTNLSDDVIDSLASLGKLDIVAGGIGRAGWTPGNVEKYVAQVKLLTPNAKIVTLFDEFSDVPGSQNLIRKLNANDLGLQRELTVAKLEGRPNIEQLSVELDKASKYGKGEIDVVSTTKAYEVKSSFQNYGDAFSQLQRLVLWSQDFGKTPVLAVANRAGEIKKTTLTAIQNLQKKYGLEVQILRFDDL